jgi:hypothetical protein
MGPIWFPVRRMRRRGLGYPKHTPPGGCCGLDQIFRPQLTLPPVMVNGDGPAVRDAFKRATAARSAWLAVSAAFCAAILDSIGESNRLAISDPDTDTDTDTLHLYLSRTLSPRDIINAMTVLHVSTVHGTMTDDGCRGRGRRLPLPLPLAGSLPLPLRR